MEIKVENVVKTYNNLNAVDGISLTIPSQTVYGLIGKSGAGKSTLLRLLSLLETPNEGKIYFNNQRVDNLSKNDLINKRRTLGMIFQNFCLLSSRNVLENITYPLELLKVEKSKRIKKAKELIKLVELEGKEYSPISKLSGGQKQRVAIARALACDPDILFCDEATSALDPETTKSILNLILNIQKKLNLTVVMVTHQMEVVRDTCTDVAVIEDGKIVESGKVIDIFSSPKTETTKNFLSHLTNDKIYRWHSGGLYTLRFRGKKTEEPVMSEISKNYNIYFNVCAGGTQKIGNEYVGTIICDIEGEDKNVKLALDELKNRGILVEEESYNGI